MENKNTNIKPELPVGNYLADSAYANLVEIMVRNLLVNKYHIEKLEERESIVSMGFGYDSVSQLEEQLVKEKPELIPMINDAKALCKHFDEVKYDPNVLWNVREVIDFD